MIRIAFALSLLASTAQAGERFDWDRYHDRQDACTQLDRLRWACAQDRRNCDELTTRQLQRECTPWRR